MRVQRQRITLDEAYKILEIQPPFTESELKSAFRTAAKKYHTDVSGDPNSKGNFIKAKDAFDLLSPDCVADREVKLNARVGKFTFDGVDITTLGKGLGVAAKKCKQCFGIGYTSDPIYGRCSCVGGFIRQGSYMRRHADCRGTGIKETGKRNIMCRACQGSGEIPTFNSVFNKNSMMENGDLTQKERKG